MGNYPHVNLDSQANVVLPPTILDDLKNQQPIRDYIFPSSSSALFTKIPSHIGKPYN